MNEINPYNLKPGVYRSETETVVMLDIINHTWNDEKQLQEYTGPVVVYRQLQEKQDEHKRFTMKLETFKAKFHAI